MKTSLILVFISILLLGLFFLMVDSGTGGDYMGRTVTTSYPSFMVKDTFKITVYLPNNYDSSGSKRYPVIYQLNGNYHGRLTAILAANLYDKQELSSDVIVVSVGYHFLDQYDRRERDYLYVAPVNLTTLQFWEENAVGGGLKFYRFLMTELIPYVDETFRTDNRTYGRTLIGHSWAGYFTLFAFFRAHLNLKAHPPMFRNYIAAAPMVVNEWNYLSGLEKVVAMTKPGVRVDGPAEIPASVYIAMSEADEVNPFPQFTSLTKILGNRGYPGFRFKSTRFKKISHVDTAIPAFQEGLKFIFPQKAAGPY